LETEKGQLKSQNEARYMEIGQRQQLVEEMSKQVQSLSKDNKEMEAKIRGLEEAERLGKDQKDERDREIN
jgi:hypothetical protein